MLSACNSILLLTKSKSFVEYIKDIADKCEVKVHSRDEWNPLYRVTEDKILCSSEWKDLINENNIKKTVILLKEGESFVKAKNKGFEQFVFNVKDERQIMYAFLTVKQVKKAVNISVGNFVDKDYRFDFTENCFYYKNMGIYLSETERNYIGNWLLKGFKDNNKRHLLFNLRKRYGKEFLSEYDFKGQRK